MRAPCFVFLCIALAFASCDSAPKQIVGKWRVEGDTSATVWEFTGNGSAQTGDLRGRYSFGDGNRLKIQTPAATFVYQIEIKGDRMTWKEPNGATTELTRVK